ncbi:MAG: hypothetical protein KJP17_04245 [Gammaproteobacteria bacterium]|nr:hypothetical protein [Gammaproteobacteria bacterium]
MLALLKTLFDIIRLRKGPDAIPYSWVITLITLLLWLVAGFVIAAVTEEMNDEDLLVGVFTGVVGLACYASIVVLSGHTPRLLQTVTAILGCGAVLSFLFVIGTVALTPLLSAGTTNLIVTLILLWSIPVEGHIIARAIDRHWYVGIVAAMAVFVFQLFLYGVLNPAVETVA